MGLRSGSMLGAAWLVFNLMASVATAAAPGATAAPPTASRSELEEKFRIARFDEDGEITMRGTWTGAFAQQARIGLAEFARQNTLSIILDSYRKRYPGATPIGDLEVSDDTANDVITLTLKMKSPTVALESDVAWTVSNEASNFEGVLPLPSAAGEALALPNGAVLRYSLDIEFPQDVVAFGSPHTKRVRDDAFEYSLDRSFLGNHSSSVQELRILQPDVKASGNRLAKYTEAARQVHAFGGTSTRAWKEGIRIQRLLAVEKPNLAQRLAHKASHDIERATRSIEVQNVRGNALSLAHCERARALSEQGKMADALRDANLAVEAAPSLAAAYACRSARLIRMGDLKAAIADSSKAIELAPLVASFHTGRGFAYFNDGQLANAAEDFARAQSASAARGETSIYMAIWETVALKRMGREPEPALRQLAAEQPRGAWPRPALALMHGLIGVDELLAAAQRKTGVEGEMVMVEADFYAGQWYVQQGEKAKAIEAFRRARATGMTSFAEHSSAGAELAALEAAGK